MTEATGVPIPVTVTSPVPMQVLDQASPAVAPKPGYKTTEFYLSLAALALTALYASGLLTNQLALAIAGIAATLLTSLGYKVSRTLVKTAGVLVLLFGLAHTTAACGASSRQKTIATTLHSIDLAEAAFLAFDGRHELDIVSAATSHEDGQKKLADYHAVRGKVNQGFVAAYRAIAAAATLDDDPSIAGMVQAAGIVAQELAELGVKP